MSTGMRNYNPIQDEDDQHLTDSTHKMARWKVWSISLFAAACFLVGIIVFSVSWAVVEPTEYGFLYNKLNGHIDTTKVYSGGRYCTGPNHYFVKYPKILTTIEFSGRKGADSAAVVTRTQDGVAITLSFAFQYKFEKDQLAIVYQRFTNNYKQPMIRIARTSLLQVASNYTSQTYWLQRNVITDDMMSTLKTALESTLLCSVADFQLIGIALPGTFEDSIIATQVQEQQVIQQQKEQQVAAYMSQIQTIIAQANQNISVINAQANTQAVANINQAHIEALNYTQTVQATAYANLQQSLQFNATQYMRYLKIRSIKLKTSGAITVGLTQ